MLQLQTRGMEGCSDLPKVTQLTSVGCRVSAQPRQFSCIAQTPEHYLTLFTTKGLCDNARDWQLRFLQRGRGSLASGVLLAVADLEAAWGLQGRRALLREPLPDRAGGTRRHGGLTAGWSPGPSADQQACAARFIPAEAV